MTIAAREQPRHRLISARVSPMVELARWLFERQGIAYAEEAHAPVLHVLATRRAGGGVEVPVVVEPEGVWSGGIDVVKRLDAKSRPGQRLLGEHARERDDNARLIEQFFAHLLHPVRRYVYSFMLPHQKVLYPIATDGAPFWERAFVAVCYPIWRRLMARALDFSPQALADAPRSILAAFELAETELGRRDTPFLGGKAPNVTDIVLAALAAPVLFPKEYGAKLPALADVPLPLRNFIEQCRARPAGKLALATYAAARTPPQPSMTMPARHFSLGDLLQNAGVQLFSARLAARYAKPLKFGKLAIVNRWCDVKEALARDLEFLIAPVNGARIDQVNGPFILGLDRGARLDRERPLLYAAVAKIDLEAVRAAVIAEADRLLDAALAFGGLIDTVNGYARLVAARTAQHLFGVAGPTEADFMRVVRAIFQHTFLNLGNDAAVAQCAVDASHELRSWANAEIARRKQAGIEIDDVMGRLLKIWPSGVPDDEGVRRNLSGLLVGAIDTTATTVAKIMAVAGRKPELLRQMTIDRDNHARLLGWCREALRLWPHNPLVLRHASTDVVLGGCAIPADSTVVLFTLAAMFDEDAFPNPAKCDPLRPADRYLHFGGGLHPCAGRWINDVQVPELVRCLLARGAQKASEPRFVGPFVDEYVVSLRGLA